MISRRNWLQSMGAVAGASLAAPEMGLFAEKPTPLPPDAPPPRTPVVADGEILPLSSTSEVWVPPRGRSFDKFSFDFPEPCVTCQDLAFGFLVFTHENAYALDREKLSAKVTPDGVDIDCTGLVWAGGQEKTAGRVHATLRRNGDFIDSSATVTMDRPIKAVTTVIRNVPRGRISTGGGFADTREDELLYGYPFSGGDLFGPGESRGMNTPLLMILPADNRLFYVSSLDDRVRTKRFFLQPGEQAYRVEAMFETEGWMRQTSVTVPTWRVGRGSSPEAVIRAHYDRVEHAFNIPRWETRADVPDWMRGIALAVTLHGQHYTGFIFNDYARQLEILRWIATRIPAGRVLAFLAAWDGRYYWDYPLYQPSPRMGGAAGFRTLVQEGRRLGFHMMPMFGANAANRKQPEFARMADAFTEKVDGDRFDLNWVDWDNDRHQEGFLSYMNLGVDSWRNHLSSRIADIIEHYGPDAYFLDIVGGFVNNPQADMHEGTRRLVADLRARYPHVVAVGEMHYDAMLSFIPMYHSFGGGLSAPVILQYARFFQHLSHPAPGRGSSGVHESGFSTFRNDTLSLTDVQIPTLNIVDDTFGSHQDVMAAVIVKARERAGI